MELVEDLGLLVAMNCSLSLCEDHAAVFGEVNSIKPLDKLAKLGHDRNNSAVRSRIDELANCLEDEFLINYECAQSRNRTFPCIGLSTLSRNVVINTDYVPS